MTRAPLYFALNGQVHATGSGNVRSVENATDALSALLDMALTERDDDLAADWVARLADLVTATREARRQGAAVESLAA